MSLWLLRSIFFESIHFDSKSASFYEFLITSTATLLMTAVSFVLCVYKMYQALKAKERNQSQQVKARWRVEERHLSRQFSVNGRENFSDQIILKRVLRILGEKESI